MGQECASALMMGPLWRFAYSTTYSLTGIGSSPTVNLTRNLPGTGYNTASVVWHQVPKRRTPEVYLAYSQPPQSGSITPWRVLGLLVELRKLPVESETLDVRPPVEAV